MVKKKGFPEEGEIVIVTVKDMTPYSALCKLDEYEGKEGMIHVSEVSGKWIRDIKKFVKKGKRYPARVLRVDKSKGHINLSLKRLSKKSRERKLQEFKNEERAEKILEEVAKEQKWKLEEAYEKIGFELQDKFGSMFKAFQEAFQSPELLERRGINKKLSQTIHEVARRSIQKKKIKLKATLKLRSFSGEGVEKIRDLLKGLEKKKLEIKYISAPKYSVEMLSDNPKADKKMLRAYLEESLNKFKEGEGSFKIKGEK